MSRRLLWITQTKIGDIVKKGNSRLLWVLPEEEIFQSVYVFHLSGTEGCSKLQRRNGSRIIRINITNKYSANARLNSVWQCLKCCYYIVVVGRRLRRRGHSLTVRATDPFLSGIIGLIVSRMTNSWLYVSVHADYKIGIEQGCLPMPVPSFLLRWMCIISTSRAKAVLPVSKYLGERIARDPWYGRSMITEPIYHYIQKDHELLINEDARENSMDIISIARLSRDKYSDLLPGIIKILVNGGWEGRLHVFGDGNLRESLERECMLLPVDFYGFKDAEIINRFRANKMFCLCLCDGATLIEAQMLGNICVVTPNEWHSEVILNGVNGYISKGMDVRDIAETLKKAIDLCPEERRRLSHNAMLTYQVKFSLKALVKTRASIYQK
jgi:glycosyltransferase involved in cell wall biosynthesis